MSEDSGSTDIEAMINNAEKTFSHTVDDCVVILKNANKETREEMVKHVRAAMIRMKNSIPVIPLEEFKKSNELPEMATLFLEIRLWLTESLVGISNSVKKDEIEHDPSTEEFINICRREWIHYIRGLQNAWNTNETPIVKLNITRAITEGVAIIEELNYQLSDLVKKERAKRLTAVAPSAGTSTTSSDHVDNVPKEESSLSIKQTKPKEAH